MISRVPLFATAALLAAGVLMGREPSECSDQVAVSERAFDAAASAPTAPAESKGEPAVTAPASEPTLTVENSTSSPAPAPSREPAKPNRKGRPAWPPPPELIA
jgi:hypothetical protein